MVQDFLSVFNRNMRSSVSDNYPQVYRLALQGPKFSPVAATGGFYGLIPPNKASTSELTFETLQISGSFYQSVFCFGL